MKKLGLAFDSDSDDWVKVDIAKQPTNDTFVAEENSEQQPLTDMWFNVRPHIGAAIAGEACNVLGMASLRAPGIGSEPRLASLDIVAVIDRSGSMSGLRIELVKKAVDFISKQLRPGDRLALVSYADNAKVDLPLTSMDSDGRLQCSQALETLQAGGVTNLGEGLLWGLGELVSSDAPAAAMLLFTDGLANRGMTKTEDLVEAMQGPISDMGRKSRAVFSFGLGTDHNAQMLFSLSDAGTGCYYYVDSAQAIAPSFADCLGGMLSVAAQDVTLTLHAKQGVSINNVHADFNVELSQDKTEARIKMRDLSSDAEKEVLFNLSVPALEATEEKWSLVACTLNYVDVADGITKTQECALTLRPLHNGEQQVDPDSGVEVHRCRLLAARAMEQAAASLFTGSLSDVQAILSEALEALEGSPARTAIKKDIQERIAALIDDLSSCLEATSDPRYCEKLCSSRAFAHKHQISTRAHGCEYRNALQQKLAEAARQEIGVAPMSKDLHSQQQLRQGGRKGRFQPPNRMSDNFSIGATSNTNAGAIPAGAVRIGMRIMCRGQPGTVHEISVSKTGKHGHAKAFFTVLGDDGVKRQDIVVSSHDVELAPEMVTKTALV
jgi:hypothetical protein